MKKILIILTAIFLPLIVLAQQTTLITVGGTILQILNIVLLIVLSLAFIYFAYGVIEFAFSKDENKRKKARDVMIYGIIGLFVIFSAWGLVKILQNTLGVQPGGVGSGCTTYPVNGVCPPDTSPMMIGDQLWCCPSY